MTIAEIHGKLSPYERMEDLLTSDVFSTFKYLNPNQGLIPFLKRAIKVIDKTNPLFLLDIVEAEYVFWPRTTKLNREPDLLIILTKEDGTTISILIEAKYTSGKSNIFRDKEKTDDLDHFDGDQLAELYKELQEGNLQISNRRIKEKFIKSNGKRYLFYTTAHHTIPKKDFEETFKILKKKKYDNQTGEYFYWINWMCITDVIDETNAKENWSNAPTMQYLLNDLKELLCRKGLIPFYGFSNLQFKCNCPKFFFWEEDVFKKQQHFFSEIKPIKRESQSYFWMGE